jgi:alpha-methylacyl-CoA racemase
MSEAVEHHHNVHRGSFVNLDGVPQPGPAPKFVRTPTETQRGCAHTGEHTEEALGDWGFGGEEIAALAAAGAVRQR